MYMPHQGFENQNAVHKLGKNASLYIILIFYTHSMFKIQTQTVQLNKNIDIMKDASYIWNKTQIYV